MVFLITSKNHHYTCAILEQVFDVGLLKLFDPIMGIVKLSMSVEVEDGYKIFKWIISSSYVWE